MDLWGLLIWFLAAGEVRKEKDGAGSFAGLGEKLEFLIVDPAPPCWKLTGFRLGRREEQLVGSEGSRRMVFGKRGTFPMGLGGCRGRTR